MSTIISSTPGNIDYPIYRKGHIVVRKDISNNNAYYRIILIEWDDVYNQWMYHILNMNDGTTSIVSGEQIDLV